MQTIQLTFGPSENHEEKFVLTAQGKTYEFFVSRLARRISEQISAQRALSKVIPYDLIKEILLLHHSGVYFVKLTKEQELISHIVFMTQAGEKKLEYDLATSLILARKTNAPVYIEQELWDELTSK